MKYERLTTRKNLLRRAIRKKVISSQDVLDRLADIEDKIVSGEIISTQLKDTSDQELKFFAEHNKSVRRLFAHELKICLQSDLESGAITQEAYEVIVGEINYCLGDVEQ